MAEAIFDAMGEVLARWTMGSAAAPAAAMWKDALGAEPQEAELRLLALSSQFLGVAVIAEPPADLRTLRDIPALSLPTVPDAVRPLVRRLLMAPIKYDLLRFIAMRGWTVHPGDWMPAAADGLAPDVYAPWRDWVEAAATSSAGTETDADDQITAENWSDFYPGWRKVVLTRLRLTDPAAARMLLEAKLAQESAEKRLGLLEVLATGLSESDVAFLESIAAADRAPKVKALATSLLARLSRGGAASDEELAELKGYFSVHVKGLLRRSRVIQFENVKTPEQRKRLGNLLENVDITGLAGALGLTDMDLVPAWPWGTDPNLDHALATLIERTGTDKVVMQAAEIASRQAAAYRLLTLSPRLTPTQRQAHTAVSLSEGKCGFDMARAIVGGTARLDNPLATPTGVALLVNIGRADAKPSDNAVELHALGLITSRVWVHRVLERLNAAGMVQGDPRLDMLRLNEALEDKGEKP
jgi:hypothetical protein